MSDLFTDQKTRSKRQIQRPSMWTVLFLNDDFTPIQFVEQVLTMIFHKNPEEARSITLKIHLEGAARVGSYTLDVAVQKVDHTLSIAQLAQHPLQVMPQRIE